MTIPNTKAAEYRIEGNSIQKVLKSQMLKKEFFFLTLQNFNITKTLHVTYGGHL